VTEGAEVDAEPDLHGLALPHAEHPGNERAREDTRCPRRILDRGKLADRRRLADQDVFEAADEDARAQRIVGADRKLDERIELPRMVRQQNLHRASPCFAVGARSAAPTAVTLPIAMSRAVGSKAAAGVARGSRA